MTGIVIFLGPSLGREAARSILDADYRPPAAHGDIFRLVGKLSSPAIIGLIDGYFQSVPAVRHKEILWALACGVHVFGAASMGALRAVELADFGMIGVGKIFEAYRDGALDDDDEVAVEHAPAAAGFTALCDPLVNIRTTLGRARDENVISAETHDRLIAGARDVFYKRRTYGNLLRIAPTLGVPEADVAALEAWLPERRVDQKRADTIALLSHIREFAATNPAPFQPQFHFEEAETWQSDMANEVGDAQDEAPPSGSSRTAILDEIRLQPGEYDRLCREALTRVLAMREIRREGIRLGEEERRRASRRLRRALGIAGRRDLEAYRAVSDLDETGFDRLTAEEAALDRALDLAAPLIERHMLDVLRVSGRYPALARRAAHKDRLAAERHLFAEHADQPIPAFQLVLWFSSQILRRNPPDNVAEYAAELGFADLEAFYRALRREYELWMDEHAANAAT